MKKLMVIAMLALATAAFGEMTLTEARGKIGDVVESPAMMQVIMSELSAEDQVQFLALVNQAIDKLNASAEEKAALFNDLNAAAMKSAKKGNLQALLAEMFATVPPEHLTVINETFAANLFSRSIDPSVEISDDVFTKRAKDAMAAIQDRAAETDESAVRTTFAILMFLRASEGTPSDLRETLVGMIPDAAVRNVALNEWIPAAMAEGMQKTYQPMLGASDAGQEPRIEVVLQISQVQAQLLISSDMSSQTSGMTVTAVGTGESTGMQNSEPVGVRRVPENSNPRMPYYGGRPRQQSNLYKLQENTPN